MGRWSLCVSYILLYFDLLWLLQKCQEAVLWNSKQHLCLRFQQNHDRIAHLFLHSVNKEWSRYIGVEIQLLVQVNKFAWWTTSIIFQELQWNLVSMINTECRHSPCSLYVCQFTVRSYMPLHMFCRGIYYLITFRNRSSVQNNQRIIDKHHLLCTHW